MSPTAEIARDLREAETLKRMGRDSYQKYHRNLAQARKRAEELKKCRR